METHVQLKKTKCEEQELRKQEQTRDGQINPKARNQKLANPKVRNPKVTNPKLANIKWKQKPSESTGFLFWQVHNLWQRRINKVLKPYGLTHVQYILLASMNDLQTVETAVTQVQLSEFSNTDIMMTSKVVRTLEEKNYIEKKKHPIDTRAYALTLTKEGMTKYNQTKHEIGKFEENFFKPLSNEKKRFRKELNLLKS